VEPPDATQSRASAIASVSSKVSDSSVAAADDEDSEDAAQGRSLRRALELESEKEEEGGEQEGDGAAVAKRYRDTARFRRRREALKRSLPVVSAAGRSRSAIVTEN
jgi:hypothetical protein